MERIETIEFNGYQATVIIPENPNGEWIWKTEFLYAFDQAERALLGLGYTRVYYQISDKYGSPDAVDLMWKFHQFITEKFGLAYKCNLFGFSRGGLYAFNFALAHPECVGKVYLDAPVLDLRTWPWDGSIEQAQMFEEYGLNRETLQGYQGNPIENLGMYFSLKIPTLVIAGGMDEIVPFMQNAGRMIEYCRAHDCKITAIVKETCLHHPHSLEDVAPIIAFCKG